MLLSSEEAGKTSNQSLHHSIAYGTHTLLDALAATLKVATLSVELATYDGGNNSRF